jgi:hypothetical protein
MRILNTGNSPIWDCQNQSRCCCRGSVEMLLLETGLVLWSLVATASALYGSGDAVVDLTPANFDKQARVSTHKCTATTLHFMCCRIWN